MTLTLGPLFNEQGGKTREWSIIIELFASDHSVIPFDGDTDKTEIKEGYYSAYYTRSGYTGMKMTNSAPTVIAIGKNIGRKNETNVLTQAVKECHSKLDAKLKAGYSASRLTQQTKKTTPFPMAVKTWSEHKSKLAYPLFIQPKLDGVRMIARYANGSVELLTRRLHPIAGFERVKEDLQIMFEASSLKSYIIDGELYSHGVNLQTISGVVRNESLNESEKELLKYHVFDCFSPAQTMIGFSERMRVLNNFVKSAPSDMIVINDTIYVENEARAEEYYKQFITHGYEGAIYKSADRPYEFDYNKEKRSSWYLKRKKQSDGEYAISGYSQGRGKDIGCIIFELKAGNGKVFNSVPNGSYDYRKELFKKAQTSFDTEFKGKLAKVVYDDLSIDNVPLRARIVQIDRDLSFD